MTDFIKNQFGENLIKNDDRYVVTDLPMEGLVMSRTVLMPHKVTTGHKHDDTDEVYIFQQGTGFIVNKQHADSGWTDQELMPDSTATLVNPGDVIAIPRGMFHQVINTSRQTMIFVSVFNNYGGRS